MVKRVVSIEAGVWWTKVRTGRLPQEKSTGT